MKKICVLGQDINAYILSLYLLKNNEVFVDFIQINEEYKHDITTKNLTQLLVESDIDTLEFSRNTNSIFKISTSFEHDGVNENYVHHELDSSIDKFIEDELVLNYIKNYCNYSKNNNKNLLLRTVYPILNFCDLNLFHENIHNFSIYENSSYQLNTQNVIKYLTEKLVEYKNLKLYKANDIAVIENNEYVEKVIVDGKSFIADLYFDCSGTNKKTTDYISTDEIFKTNELLNVKVEYKNKYVDVIPYTKTIGLDYAWKYIVPTYDYNNINFIYDNRNSNDNLLDSLNDYEIIEQNKIEYKSGYHKNIWIKNKISLGASAYYLEPIEGNETLLTTSLIKYISYLFHQEFITEYDKCEFNQFYYDSIKTCIHDIIINRYQNSKRHDTEFWKYFHTVEYYEMFSKYIKKQTLDHMFLKNHEIDISYIYKMINDSLNYRLQISNKYANYYQWLKNNIFEKE